jgi:hypothetical protein
VAFARAWGPRALLLMATACGPGARGAADTSAAPATKPASTGAASAKGKAPVFLWSLPVTASEGARALTAGSVHEDEVGHSLRISFRLAGDAAQESRRRFPTLSPRDPADKGTSSSPFTIAPFAEVPQKVSVKRSEATFVIDYDEPPVQALLAQVPAEKRTPAGLEAFVASTLETTYGRGFDIASRVATLKVGDCTEHAVLLAALLRASGYSARVIVGVVVLLNPDFALAAGHAWVEVAEAGLWRRRDAALYRDGAGNWTEDIPGDASALRHTVRLYLTTNVLESEGPGFARELMSYATKFSPTDLSVERIEAR